MEVLVECYTNAHTEKMRKIHMDIFVTCMEVGAMVGAMVKLCDEGNTKFTPCQLEVHPQNEVTLYVYHNLSKI